MVPITYEYPLANIQNLVVTNNRETAVQFIEKGYELFSVPQMFGEESGTIVLYLENQHSPKKSGMEILRRYEDMARSHTFGGSLSPVHTNVSH